jgi:putative exporter of polyketide antibiotics
MLILRIHWLQDRIGALFMAFHAVVLPMLVFYFALHVAPGRHLFLLQLFAGGIAAGSGIAVISSVGYGMLADVQTGRLSLLCASGVGKASYFSAYLISALLLSLLSIAFSLVLLAELDVISIDASRPSVAVIAALGTGAASCGLGALVATTAPDHATGRDRLSLASAGLAFLSPVFYRESDLPLPLRVLTWGSPFTHATNLDGAVLNGGELPIKSLVAIVVIGVAWNLMAFRMLKWQ